MPIWINYANLALLAVTCGAIIWYTVETRRLRRETARMVKATLTPCLGIDVENVGRIHLQNAGSGAALNVDCRLSAGTPGRYFVSALGPQGTYDLRGSFPTSQRDWWVHAMYTSLDGRRFESRLDVKGQEKVLTWLEISLETGGEVTKRTRATMAS